MSRKTHGIGLITFVNAKSISEMFPRKFWSFIVTDEGLTITPVYSGNFGCRSWTFETLGM